MASSKSNMPMRLHNRMEPEKQNWRELEMRILMMLLLFDHGRSFAKPSLPVPLEIWNHFFAFPASFKTTIQHPNLPLLFKLVVSKFLLRMPRDIMKSTTNIDTIVQPQKIYIHTSIVCASFLIFSFRNILNEMITKHNLRNAMTALDD